MQSTITFRQPHYFTLGLKILGSAFSILPSLVIWAVLIAGWVGAFFYHRIELLPLSVLLVVLLLAIERFVMPFMQGNFLIPKYLPKREAGFITQITFTPRRHQGVEGMLDDADDFGIFTIAQSHILFRGESVDLDVHFNDMLALHFENAGWRTFWMLGDAAHVTLKQPINHITKFVIFCREGNTLFSARKATKRLKQYISAAFFTPPPIPGLDTKK